MSLTLTSSAFGHQQEIPAKYTCEGHDISPPLAWTELPEGTVSCALVMDDPDASQVFTHWLIYNIPVGVNRLAEGVAPEPQLSGGILQGMNDFGRIGYGGPCPPPGRDHHYRFRFYALDAELDIGPGATKAALLRAMEGHIMSHYELVGRFRRG